MTSYPKIVSVISGVTWTRGMVKRPVPEDLRVREG